MADQVRAAANPITELTNDAGAWAYETAGSIRLAVQGKQTNELT